LKYLWQDDLIRQHGSTWVMPAAGNATKDADISTVDVFLIAPK